MPHSRLIALDLHEIRADFPALTCLDASGRLPLFLDGPGGGQAPRPVLDAIVGYLGRYNSNLGGYADAGVRTQQTMDAARAAAADWLGAASENVVFGPNSTTLMFNVSRAVAQTFAPGDNVVVTDLDHFSNVSSWRRAAEDAGVEVRVLPLDAAGCDLDFGWLAKVVDGRTRVVAVTAASNLLGTLPDVPRVVAAARAVGALVSVDAVHAAVHVPVDFAGWDADFLFASAYKLGGPHLGMCVAKAEHLRGLRPYKVEPATEEIPGRWEQGTQSFEALAGLAALVDYWAGLGAEVASDRDPAAGPDSGARTTRRQQILSAYQRVDAHDRTLTEAVLAEFARRPGLRLYGIPTAQRRTPTFAFNVIAGDGVVDAAPLVRWLGERNVALGLGNFYALGAVRALGVEAEGVLRIGCVHYNTLDEVRRFFELLDEGLVALR